MTFRRKKKNTITATVARKTDKSATIAAKTFGFVFFFFDIWQVPCVVGFTYLLLAFSPLIMFPHSTELGLIIIAARLRVTVNGSR